MVSTTALAETAALVGDPARANMLAALMDGRALTAPSWRARPPSRHRPQVGTWPG